MAVATAHGSNSRAAALHALLQDRFSASSRGPRDGCWKTWQRFHVLWHPVGVPVLPLDRSKVAAVASLFKAGGYRSFSNYLCRAKDEHLRRGFDWPCSLDRACRLAVRSACRGLGPARQSAEFKFSAVSSLPGARTDVAEGETHEGRALLVLGTFFLLRELEAACATVGDLSIDQGASVVTMNLPVSKTDPSGRGVSRSWGCLCEDSALAPSVLCRSTPR